MAVYLYDELTRQLVTRMTSNGIKLNGHTNRVFCTKWLPEDPNVCITGGWDRIMKVYDTRVGKPVAQILGPLVAGDAIDIGGDEILAGSNRHQNPLAIYSISMGKVIQEIPFDPPHMSYDQSGYVMCCRFSKDRDRSIIFAGGAGRNELRAYDNDTVGIGSFKQIGSINENRSPILCMDTATNGTQMAWGNHLGHIYISNYDLHAVDEEPDIRTVMGRVQARRQAQAQQAAAAAQ